MWQASEWVAWVVSGIIIVWLVWDFFRINTSYREETLLSSREGVDELFGGTNPSKGA